MRLADVRNLFTEEGAHHVLTLKRGDETIEVESPWPWSRSTRT